MNMVFDIDDTITDETGFLLNYAPKYLKKKYKIEPKIKNPNGYNLSEIFDLKRISFSENTDEAGRKKLEKKIENDFWNTYFILYMFWPLKKDVRHIINKFKDAGYNIYFVSNRGKETQLSIDKNARYKMIFFLTWMQLKINCIKFNQIKIVGSIDEKIDFVKKKKQHMFLMIR